jgi:hypothetical protein
MPKDESFKKKSKSLSAGKLERLGGKKLAQHGAENFQKLQKHKHGSGGRPHKSG